MSARNERELAAGALLLALLAGYRRRSETTWSCAACAPRPPTTPHPLERYP